MTPPTYVIHHAPCRDGYCARLVAHMALGDDATYVGAQYGDPMPEVPEGATVVMVDVSWPRGDMLRLAERVGDLTVLDHHQTARDALTGLDFALFDMDKSGARLAWEFFFPHKDVPAIVEHVEDWDLWRFDIEGTREVCAYLDTLGWSLPRWINAHHLLEERHERVVEIGAAVLRYKDEREREAAEDAHWVRIPGFEGHPVLGEDFLGVNLGVKSLVSGTLHRLLDENEAEDVVASYRQIDGGVWEWSLRSRDGADCSVIAKEMGGGGHAQACGFRTDTPPEVPDWDLP